MRTARPSNPGAWLARNSWGELYGEGGYFYISYEEGSLKDASVYDVETCGGAGEYVYEYDPLGQIGHMSPEPGVFEGWGAKRLHGARKRGNNGCRLLFARRPVRSMS